MNNNERLSAIGNSLRSIGSDLKAIAAGFFCKPSQKVEQVASVSAEALVPAPDDLVTKAADHVESPAAVESSAVAEAEPKLETDPIAGRVQEALSLKVCSRCKVKKPLDTDHYHRDASKISGFRSACRDCSNGGVKHVVCNGCGVDKPLTPQFWQRNSKAKSGFRNPCKECLKKPRVA